MEHTRYYRNAGLLIASEIALDELAQTVAPADPDLCVLRATAADVDAVAAQASKVLDIGAEGAPWLTIHRTADAYLVRWPEGLDVVLPDDGKRMLVLQRADIADSVPRLLLCQSLSFILASHGREALHASAVEIDGRAVAVAGEPGRGKSTLATALCQAGGRLLADDLAVARLQADGVVLVEPGSTKTWLLHDVARAMVGSANGGDTPRIHKRAVGGDGIAHATDAVPLSALYLLRFGDGGTHVSEPLNGTDAVVHFLAALFNMVVRSPARMEVQFRISTEVAARATLRTVRWQPGPETARLLAQRIIDDVAGRGRSNGNGGTMSIGIPANGLGAPLGVATRQDRGEQRRQILALLRDAGVADQLEDGMDEPLLRTSQVAALLRSSDRTVRSWADAGKLRYVKTLGGRRLFPASAVLSALKQMNAGVHEEA